MRVEHADRRQKAAQCGIATVTYFDREGAAPRVTWRGVPFRDGEAVVLDDARHAELIEQAATHPWFSVDRDDPDDEVPEASALEAAAEFLTRALANGPVPQTAVRADANASGISTATLRRAKAKLGVEAVKQGMDAGWVWALPIQELPRGGPASAEDPQREDAQPEEPWAQDYHKALQRIPIEPPADVPQPRWERFRNDAAEFLDRWGREAKRLGWSVPDLFGADPARRVARYDRTGLVWALQGETVVALAAETACLSGGLTYRRPTSRTERGSRPILRRVL
ncbi:hypothetical protein SAMN05444161_6862 [Rhizobiales bacterium GAS191]|nr:hypothetical protein SAMN05444161_6862 [Rhizobiales bacterium GAS191]